VVLALNKISGVRAGKFLLARQAGGHAPSVNIRTLSEYRWSLMIAPTFRPITMVHCQEENWVWPAAILFEETKQQLRQI